MVRVHASFFVASVAGSLLPSLPPSLPGKDYAPLTFKTSCSDGSDGSGPAAMTQKTHLRPNRVRERTKDATVLLRPVPLAAPF